MDSVLFLAGCVGFAWLVLWSMRDFDKPTKWFWPFDARWMQRSSGAAAKSAEPPARGPSGGPPSGGQISAGQPSGQPGGRWNRRPPSRWRGRP